MDKKIHVHLTGVVGEAVVSFSRTVDIITADPSATAANTIRIMMVEAGMSNLSYSGWFPISKCVEGELYLTGELSLAD